MQPSPIPPTFTPPRSRRPWLRRARPALASLALAAATPFAAADPNGIGTGVGPVAFGEPPVRTAADIWRIAPATTYSDPRGIVLEESTNFRGTMTLNYRPALGGSVGTYMIDRVNWLVSLSNQPGHDTYVTGYGTYQITSSVGMMQVIGHRMILDVRWGSEGNRRRFDSGNVPMAVEVGGAPVDLVLYEVPFITFDPVGPPPPNPGLGGEGNPPPPQPEPGLRATLRVAVAPVPTRQIVPAQLNTRESSFSEGCFEPCRCALTNQNMSGSFSLIPLNTSAGGPGSGAATEWAMVNISTATPPTSGSPLVRTFNGDGIYQRFPVLTPVEGARPNQRLRARLTDSQGFPADPPNDWFDSGTVPSTLSWPKIKIDIADNGFVCFNRVLSIAAKTDDTRRPTARPEPFPIGIPAPSPEPMPFPGNGPADR